MMTALTELRSFFFFDIVALFPLRLYRKAFYIDAGEGESGVEEYGLFGAG